MERCLHRPQARRALVMFLAALVMSSFAFQARDDGVLVHRPAGQSAAGHFVSDAFPTAEASVVGAR